ncbi:MAG: hypothetical protein AAFX52_13815 [Pseudomonadota bacterium]
MNQFLTTSLCVLALSANIASANEPEAATALEFGLDDTLFIADSVQGKIFAYDLPDVGVASRSDDPFNVLDLENIVEDVLRYDRGTLTYNDLAVHPVTRDAYITVSFEHRGKPNWALVSVTPDGMAQKIDLSKIPSSTMEIEDSADDSVSFWRDIPAPTLTVTDMDFYDGELFVSGISTGEFASTLRRIPFPFESSSSSSSIEIFHAAHGQNETRAPIRALSVVDIDGTPTVVAAYTCTPLVTIPVAELEDGANVTGKTIAELGYGNTPLDIVSFAAADMEGNVGAYVLVVNREMDADLITMENLKAAAESDGISQPIPYLGATVGVPTTPLPLAGVVHATDQNNQFLLTMRRNLDTGAMELVSFRKAAYFRLSNFISEYNFPDYQYSEDPMSQGTRMFQNMLKVDEDFPDQTVN